MTFPKWAYNICGNFGFSFFTPLTSINLAKTIFEVEGGLTFYHTIITSLLVATIGLGLSVSKEALERGKAKWNR